MTIDNVSISDVGTSLVAIEKELKDNLSSIKYYENLIEELKVKNAALKELTRALLLNALPLTTRGY